MSEVIEVEFTVEKEIFYKASTSWGSYACIPTDEYRDEVKYNPYGNLSLNGLVPRLDEGSKWKAKIIEQPPHPKYGVSYRIEKIYQDIPTTVNEQRKYLEKILTKNQVDEIYKAYDGEDIIQLFKDNKVDHSKLNGFGEFRLERVRNKVLENLDLHEALIELIDYDLTYAAIAKLVKEYGSASLVVQEIKNNPYVLTKVHGFGFKRVDHIALSVGYDREGEYRIHSAIRYLIGCEQQSGNSYIKKDELLKQTVELIEVDKQLIEEELNREIEGVKVVGDKVTFKKTYDAEHYIYEKLNALQFKSKEIDFDLDQFLKDKMEKENINLTDEQKQFFYNFMENQVNFLIGYAGCGKSFLQSILIEIMKKTNLTYQLLAPTGKAAKVMSEYTGVEASTIHRACGIFDEDSDAINYIHADVVIIDESSMIDVYVLSKLLSRIQTRNAKLLFIGDDFQLPSVSVGNILYDCINSGKFTVTRLTKVFRQSEGGILDIATKIRLGEQFVEEKFLGKDKFGKDTILHSVKQENMIKAYKHYYQLALKKYDKDDIMVLSPTKKGKLGTHEINKQIQSIVNPQSEEKDEYKYGEDTIFRVGDNVINIKNTYNVLDQNEEKIDIVNGDMGKIIAIDLKNKKITIDFDFAVVDYSTSDMQNVLHSYCLTIHKSQGSAAKVVIMVSDIAHKYQINANLLYTGVSRSKEFLFLISQGETINFGMKKNLSMDRNSFLKEFLKEAI